jgi:transcriptional regulator with XRE-family HTH domain
MDINTLTRKLKTARYESKKQAEIAAKLSREIVERINQRLKDNHMSMALASKRSGISHTQLVNWLCGNMKHAFPEGQVAVLWKAITPQKPSATHQLKNLTDFEWVSKDNETLAREIGCGKEHVRVMRKLKAKQITTQQK